MDIQALIEKAKKEQLTIEELRALAANMAAFGTDIIEALAGQAERRASAAGALLETADKETRDLLASENRQYQRLMTEADAVRSLQSQVELRTAQRSHVPVSQARRTAAASEDISPVLTPEQPMSKWLEQRGGYHYVGETANERLSFGRVVRALATGQRSDLSDLERRVLAEGTGAAGGFTVPEILATSFIDRMRNRLVLQRAGARIVPMTSDVLHLARLAQPGVFGDGSPGGPAPVWKLENDPIVEGDLTLERISFNSKTLPIILRMSVELSEDSVNIDSIVETELAAAFALELERVGLIGSGVNPEPQGILNQSDVTVTAYDAVPTSWDFAIDGIGDVWAANHEPNGIITNSVLATHLAKLKDSTGQPLQLPPALAGIPRYRTNAIEGTGSPAGDSSVFIGDFTQLMIGLRTSFRLEVSRVAADAFENLQIAVRAYLRADIQLAHPEAFTVLTGVDTTT